MLAVPWAAGTDAAARSGPFPPGFSPTSFNSIKFGPHARNNHSAAAQVPLLPATIGASL